MVVQASAGQRLAAREPSRAAETFGVIATAARQAQADLDRLADLLAQDAAAGSGADLGLVREIVDTARAFGLHVTLHVAGDTSGVSTAVAVAGPRVVQERPDQCAALRARRSGRRDRRGPPGALELTVINGTATTAPRLGLGAGRGLTGLRERVGACHACCMPAPKQAVAGVCGPACPADVTAENEDSPCLGSGPPTAALIS
jgi:hypothetical protein